MAALALRTMDCPLSGSTLLDDLAQLWRNEMARRQHRRRLGRLSPRLIADLGFDPHEVRATVENSWDEWHPDQMLRSAPWI